MTTCPGGKAVRRTLCQRLGIRPNLAVLSALFFASTAWNPVGAPTDQEVDSAAPPFSPGERLLYKVEWDPPWFLFFLPRMEAGELELVLDSDVERQGKPAWKISFKARSSGTLSKLAGVNVDDHFESLTDPVTLCTYAVKKKIREGKRKRDIDVVYFPADRSLHIRELDVAQVPPRTVKDRHKEGIPECVKDVFSALYALRREDLKTGFSRRWVIGDNDTVKDVETRVLRNEVVHGPGGPTLSLHVETIALLGGLFKQGGQFRIWLSDDRRRLPLKFQAHVKLGKVDGQLVSVTYR